LTEPNDLLLHVNLLDASAAEQQDALGVLGVNLLYAARYARESAQAFLGCLLGNLRTERLEIDVLDFAGPSFAGQDPAAWCLQLLRHKIARAILFDPACRVVEPSSVLRKRPLVVDRGRFETVEPFHPAMLESAQRALRAEGAALGREPQSVLEMALHPIIDDDAPDDAAILSRIRNMLSVGPALLTDLPEGFRLVPYLRRYTQEPIRLVGGISLLARMLQVQFYDALPGNLLEGMGKLFASNVVFYVYPMPREAVDAALGPEMARKICVPNPASPLIGGDDLIIPAPLNHLYRYLRETGRVVPIKASGPAAPG
jgi:hypothetical protein